MALATCRECGKQVSTEAKTCPHCGTPTPAKVVRVAQPVRMGKVMKVVAWVIGLAIFGNVVGPLLEPRNTSQTNSVTSPSPKVADASKADLCYKKGANVATVLLANYKQAADVGMGPMEMMTKGCQQISKDQGAECAQQCEAGFKAEAKQFVKDVTH